MNDKPFDYQFIDLETWPRKNHFNFFKTFTDPCFNICLTINVSHVLDHVHKTKQPLSSTLLYLSAKAVNATRAFRLRIDNNQRPYIIETVHPSCTIINKDETFTFCNFTYVDDMDEFIKRAKIQQAHSLTNSSLSAVDNQANQVFYSIIPWLHFTGYKHARSGTFEDIPRIVFGKIINENERAIMPVSVELHHALADAIDVAKYIETFQQLINELK